MAEPPTLGRGAVHGAPPRRLSGRVLEVGAGTVVLANAGGAVRVEYRLATPLALGQLVSLQVAPVAASADLRGPLQALELIGVGSGQLRPDGLFARFTQAGVAANLRARAEIVKTCRSYFETEGFVEVQTPTRVRAPGTDVHIEPQSAGSGFLITSPEFHLKRLLVGGLPRIYEIARCFRGDEVGPYHQPEFSLLEWYRAFSDVESVMLDTERLVVRCAQQHSQGMLHGPGGSVPVTGPFPRLSVGELFREVAGVADASNLAATDEDRYFQIWVDKIDPYLSALPSPTFIIGFPICQAALARPDPRDPTVAERFELVVAGLELCNGYGELCDPKEQAVRFESDRLRRAEAGRPCPPVDEGLIDALREGMPPSGGNALGLDRLVSLCLGKALDQAVAFPVRG